MKSTLYVLSGPFIWFASLLLLMAMGSGNCVNPSVATVVQLLAVGGCAVVLYRALTSLRNPARTLGERERMVHFLAGGAAVLSMAGIGGTALFSVLWAGC